MRTNFFFDDEFVFSRRGFERRYGALEPLSAYAQPGVSVGGGVCVLREGDRYLMYMNGWPHGAKDTVSLLAESGDGIHWTPADLGGRARGLRFDNQFLPDFDGELSQVIEDPNASPSERVKAFITVYHRDENRAENRFLVSADGLHFSENEASLWRYRGAEPGMGGAYRPDSGDFVFIVRPDWGVRKLYSITTADFRTWSELRPAMTPDSEDPPLAESYGMPILLYKGLYIGFLWLYCPPDVNGPKYRGGTVFSQLAYSGDGCIWKRSLRAPFLGNTPGTMTSGMVFPSCVVRQDHRLLLYAHGSESEHGDFNGQRTAILTFGMREDGFIGLWCSDGHFCSSYIRLSGKISLNLQAEYATCAFLDMRGAPIPGFSHGDCQPFSGDSVQWTPRYAADAAFPSDQPVMMEIIMKKGVLYSYTGEFENLTPREASRVARGMTVKGK